jgi:outer membrane protein TolC
MSLRMKWFRPFRRSLCLLLFLSLGCAEGDAQNRLTLDQCVALAVSTNPRLALAVNAERASQAALSELSSSGLPQLDAVGSARYAPIPPGWAYDPALSDGGQLLGQVVLRQPVYDGGIRSLRSGQLELDIDRAVQARNLAAKDLAYTVTLAFIEALRSQEEVVIRRESRDQLSSYEGLLRRLHAGGEATYADLLKAEMQTSVASVALHKAFESAANARFDLAEQIGVSVDSSTVLVEPVAHLVREPVDTSAVDRTLEMSLLGIELEKSALDVQLASHERLPVVSLVADAGFMSSGVNLRLPSPERLTTWGYSIGIGVEIPILNWGATTRRVEQRELAADDARLRMDLLRRSLTAEMGKTLVQSDQARARLDALREVVAKAEENFLLTKSLYAGGGTLALDVFASQQLLTETKMEVLQAQADLRLLNARLKRLTAPTQPARSQ